MILNMRKRKKEVITTYNEDGQVVSTEEVYMDSYDVFPINDYLKDFYLENGWEISPEVPKPLVSKPDPVVQKVFGNSGKKTLKEENSNE